MDAAGNVHPYSEEYLKTTKFYHERKLRQYNVLKHRMDKSDPEYFNPHDEQFQNEMKSLKDSPKDVLELHVADAVKDLSPEDYVFQFKDHITFSKGSLKTDGGMHDYSRTYMDEQDLANYKFRKPNEQGYKSLRDFVEQDDKDIYDRLREDAERKAKGLPKKEEPTDFSHLYKEADESMLKPPTLQDFFDKEAQGKSPIGSHLSGVDYENQEVDEAFDRVQEALGDELTYRKELVGRMFGGNLTAR